MTLQQLKYLHGIARYGSSLAASKHLFVSQPSISAAVRALETELGFPLFTRGKNGMVLTEEGAAVMEEVEKIISATEKIQSLKRIRKTKMIIGYRTQYEYKLIANSILALYQQDSPISLSAKWFSGVDTFLAAIDQGEADSAVMNTDVSSSEISESELKARGLVFDIIGTDRLGFLTSSSHPAAKKEACRFQDLATSPFVSLYPENSKLWAARDSFLKANGYTGETLFIENIMEIDRAVASINGFTTLYRSDYEKRNDEFKAQYALIFPSDMDLKVRFYWIRKPVDNPFLTQLDEVFRREFRKLLIE